jgi:hypothetical protein
MVGYSCLSGSRGLGSLVLLALLVWVDADDADDAVQILDGRELDGDLALALPQRDRHPSVEVVAEPGG